MDKRRGAQRDADSRSIRVVSVRFSPDGHYLASAGAEKPGQVWDARPLEPRGRPPQSPEVQ